ncbi:tetratricopeptide repeat protein [Metabacillus sp. GX 13764]|uniref:tetratricopeptide repeat protein n=1 Tax=Metabacillus kandeliae TaxID=2900151 RepID=UPI001E29E7A2|nr:tetratricopeptide repeat protein [Metabacillus kandeliae]MCD7036426.1 tetratricopeptide repeat protein [Metabacillus kandeliae]
MDDFLNIVAAFGGITFLIVVVVFIVILIFKKQLNPVIENIKSLKFRELEINSERTTVNSSEPQVNDNEEVASEPQIAEGSEAKIEEKEEKDKFRAFLKAWVDKDIDELKRAFEILQGEETKSNDKLKNEALYYSFLYRLGHDSNQNFNLIEKKAEQTEVYGDVMYILATSYENTRNYELAISYYEKGLKLGINKSDTSGRLIRGLATSKFTLGFKKEAYEILLATINSSSDNEEKFSNFIKIEELYKKENKLDYQISALEKALEIKPNNVSALFDLAYAYAQNNQNELALLHYKTIISIEPTHQNALNNLGVIYSDLGMHFNKIKSYKKAFELGNTLSASNLAYEYIKVGLEEDAKGILFEANSKKDVDENVGKALVKLGDQLNSEKQNEEETIEKATKERDFEKNLASARFDNLQETDFRAMSGEWILNNKFTSNIEVERDRLIILWTKYLKKYKFEGAISGKYFSLDYFEMDYKYPSIATDELGFKNKGTAVGFLESKCEIFIRKNSDFEIFNFTKQGKL